MTNTNALGQYLRAELQRRGWEQQDLAYKAGLSQSDLIDMLNKPVVPRLETLDTLARTLDVPLETLIEAAGFQLRSRPSTTVPVPRWLEPFLPDIQDLSDADVSAVVGYLKVAIYNRRQAR